MSTEVVFRLDEAAVNSLLAGPEGAVAVWLERTAIRVENGAKRLCPVDTGRLRSSITHGLFREEGELTAHVGTDVEYAVHVELGTSRAVAQPYLRPALYAELQRSALSLGDTAS